MHIGHSFGVLKANFGSFDVEVLELLGADDEEVNSFANVSAKMFLEIFEPWNISLQIGQDVIAGHWPITDDKQRKEWWKQSCHKNQHRKSGFIPR